MVEGDDEYELDREEPCSPSLHEWKVILMKAEFADDLCEHISMMKPYKRCERTGRVVPTKSLQDLIQGFFLFLDCGAKIVVKVMKNLTRDVFASCDLLFEICSVLPDQLLKLRHDAVSTWFNVFHFLKFVPDPQSFIKPRIFKVACRPSTKTAQEEKNDPNISRVMDWFNEVSTKVLPVMIPYISENILDKLNEPHKTADFFFRAFDKGDKFAILSLEAIFKLIVSHNFEYPNFYDHVYSLTRPSVLYLDHKEKFIKLLDKFLSSTHIPNYVVAGFAKRLSRMLLYAPLDAQEPVLGLIRNLLTRHPNISSLIHREVPETLPSDPYNDNESSLSKCCALNSSLWEIKMESFVRFRSQDELFSGMMAKPFGNRVDSMEEKYNQAQDGSEDEDVAPSKRNKTIKTSSSSFEPPDKPHNSAYVLLEISERKRKDHGIPTNFLAPPGNLFPENSFYLTYEKFWAV
ncbi:unnamed protein product [Angiostrongylus costaricensis]|uniref:CBF domain-containing protein n=1 Tax=Angiostrongylus costaricensis TaxID=334426 RepID=A0A0R3PUD4_ANGCS|nr:unnamed protein product [Angiostrongylus costaricensis]